MSDLAKYIGTWHGQTGDPGVIHTLTWKSDGSGLRGRYIMQPPQSTAPSILMEISEPVIEDEVLIFTVQHSPFPAEFRLVAENEAIFGAASRKLPAELLADHRRSIEKHRVRLSRKNI